MDGQSERSIATLSRRLRNQEALIKHYECRRRAQESRIGMGQNYLTLLEAPYGCLVRDQIEVNTSLLMKGPRVSPPERSTQLQTQCRVKGKMSSSPRPNDRSSQPSQAVASSISPTSTNSKGSLAAKQDDTSLLPALRSNHSIDVPEKAAIEPDRSFKGTTCCAHISIPAANFPECTKSPWNARSHVPKRYTQIPADQLALLSREDSWIRASEDINPAILPIATLSSLRGHHARKDAIASIGTWLKKSNTHCVGESLHHDIAASNSEPQAVGPMSIEPRPDDVLISQLLSGNTITRMTFNTAKEVTVSSGVSSIPHGPPEGQDDELAVACVEAAFLSSPPLPPVQLSARYLNGSEALSPSFAILRGGTETNDFQTSSRSNSSCDMGQSTVCSEYDGGLLDHSVDLTANGKSVSKSLNIGADIAGREVETLTSCQGDENRPPENGPTQDSKDDMEDVPNSAPGLSPLLQVQRTPMHGADVIARDDDEDTVASGSLQNLLPADIVPATFPESSDSGPRTRSSSASTHDFSREWDTVVAKETSEQPPLQPCDRLQSQHQETRCPCKNEGARNGAPQASPFSERCPETRDQYIAMPATDAIDAHTVGVSVPLLIDDCETRHTDVSLDKRYVSTPKTLNKPWKRSQESPEKHGGLKKKIRVSHSELDKWQTCSPTFVLTGSTKTLMDVVETITENPAQLTEPVDLQPALKACTAHSNMTTVCSPMSSSITQSSLGTPQTVSASLVSDQILPVDGSHRGFCGLQSGATTGDLTTGQDDDVTLAEWVPLSTLANKADAFPGGPLDGMGNLHTLDVDIGCRGLYHHYRISYPLYDASLETFVNACVHVDWLETRAPHPSLWDDFVRACWSEYPDYVRDCTEAHTSPLACIDFYNLHVQVPSFSAHVLSRSTLSAALLIDSDLTARARRSLIARESSTTDGILKDQIAQKVSAGFDTLNSISGCTAGRPTPSECIKLPTAADVGNIVGYKAPSVSTPGSVSRTTPNITSIHRISATTSIPSPTLVRRPPVRNGFCIGGGPEVLRIIRSDSKSDLESAEISYKASARNFRSRRSIVGKDPSLHKQ